MAENSIASGDARLIPLSGESLLTVSGEEGQDGMASGACRRHIRPHWSPHKIALLIGPSFSFRAVQACREEQLQDTPMTWEGLLLSGMAQATQVVAGTEEKKLQFEFDLASQIESHEYKEKQKAALTIKQILQAADCYRPWLTGVFNDYEINEHGQRLVFAIEKFSNKGGAIATSNIDHVIENGFSEDALVHPVQMTDHHEVDVWVRGWEDTDTDDGEGESNNAGVLHLFGHVGEPDNVVLDYSCDHLGKDDGSMMFMWKTFLLVGYDDLALPQLINVAEFISGLRRGHNSGPMFHYLAVKEHQVQALKTTNAAHCFLPFPYGEDEEDFALLLEELSQYTTRKRSYREVASHDLRSQTSTDSHSDVVVCVVYEVSQQTSGPALLAMRKILQATPDMVKVRRVSSSSSKHVTYEMTEDKARQLWWLAATNSELLASEKIEAVQIENGPMLWLGSTDHASSSDESDGTDCISVSSLSTLSIPDEQTEDDTDVDTERSLDDFPSLPTSREGPMDLMQAARQQVLQEVHGSNVQLGMSRLHTGRSTRSIEKHYHIATEFLKYSEAARIREICKAIQESSGVESIDYQRARNGTVHFTVRGRDDTPDIAIRTIQNCLSTEQPGHHTTQPQLTEGNLQRLESRPMDLRQFSCLNCNYVWWRRVLRHKPVSRCKKCSVRYDPIDRDKEFGFGHFQCYTCGHSFTSARAQRGVASLCFNCQRRGVHSECFPETIEPLGWERGRGRGRGQGDGTRRKRRPPHACSLCEFGKINPCPLFSIVVVASDPHISTGSTVSTFISQLSGLSVDGDGDAV